MSQPIQNNHSTEHQSTDDLIRAMPSIVDTADRFAVPQAQDIELTTYRIGDLETQKMYWMSTTPHFDHHSTKNCSAVPAVCGRADTTSRLYRVLSPSTISGYIIFHVSRRHSSIQPQYPRGTYTLPARHHRCQKWKASFNGLI